MTTETIVSPMPQNSSATSDAPASEDSQKQHRDRGGNSRTRQNAHGSVSFLRRRGTRGNGDISPGGLEVGQFVALVRRVERLQRQMEYYVSARYTKERIRYARRFQAVLGQLSERIADELDAVSRDVNRLRKGRTPTGPLADELGASMDGGSEDTEV